MLIEEAMNYGWIDEEAKLKLFHLYELRGAYAHPINLAPLDYEVECAIRQGIDLVLSKPTLLNHSYVNNLVKNLFNLYNFIEDDSEEIRKEARKYIQRINPKYYGYFFKKIVENIKAFFYDLNKKRYIRRGREFLFILLTEHTENNIDDKWEVKSFIHDGCHFLSKLILNIEVWLVVSDEIKSLAFNDEIDPVQELGGIEKPYIESMKKINILKNNDLLNEKQLGKFHETLKQYNSYAKKTIGVPLNEVVKDIIIELKSRNWHVQNPAIELLYDIKDFNNLDYDLLVELGRNIIQSANGGANNAVAFTQNLNAETVKEWPIAIIEGMFLETIVNEKGHIRFKNHAIAMLNLISSYNSNKFDGFLKSALLLLPEELNKGNTKIYPKETLISYVKDLNQVHKVQSESEFLNEFRDFLVKVNIFVEG